VTQGEERCRDCRWWKRIRGEAGSGDCSVLGAFGEPDGKIYLCQPGPDGDFSDTQRVVTGELFGCIHFEAKA